MADDIRTRIVGDTAHENAFSGTLKFRQEQQELHGTPLHPATIQGFERHRRRGARVALGRTTSAQLGTPYR